MDEQELNNKLNDSQAERVTSDYIRSRIVKTEYIKIGGTVTICSITLNNGFSVRGESACVKIENYNKEIGETIAYDDAFEKFWVLFGFLLAENGTLKK